MELRNVYVSFDEKTVLRSLNFSWSPGETVTIIGANGAGKTTLLKLISLLLKPSSGEIHLDGMPTQVWKRSLGIVLPESFLYNDLTAYENLKFYQNLYGETNQESIVDLLEIVQLNTVKDELVGTFSKGMKQRLSIARALIHNPTHLILDEPFDGLDLNSKQIIESLLVQKKEKGIGWILVSHDVEHAWSLCDQAILMDKGTILLNEQCSEESYLDFMIRYKEALKGNNNGLS
jgi:ABC-type multidrug transport system ATPase subunit